MLLPTDKGSSDVSVYHSERSHSFSGSLYPQNASFKNVRLTMSSKRRSSLPFGKLQTDEPSKPPSRHLSVVSIMESYMLPEAWRNTDSEVAEQPLPELVPTSSPHESPRESEESSRPGSPRSSISDSSSILSLPRPFQVDESPPMDLIAEFHTITYSERSSIASVEIYERSTNKASQILGEDAPVAMRKASIAARPVPEAKTMSPRIVLSGDGYDDNVFGSSLTANVPWNAAARTSFDQRSRAGSLSSDSIYSQDDEVASIITFNSIQGGLTDPRMSRYLPENSNPFAGRGRRASSEIVADPTSKPIVQSTSPSLKRSKSANIAEKRASQLDQMVRTERTRFEEENFRKDIWNTDSRGLLAPPRGLGVQLVDTKTSSGSLSLNVPKQPVKSVSVFEDSDGEDEDERKMLNVAKITFASHLKHLQDHTRHKSRPSPATSKSVSRNPSITASSPAKSPRSPKSPVLGHLKQWTSMNPFKGSFQSNRRTSIHAEENGSNSKSPSRRSSGADKTPLSPNSGRRRLSIMGLRSENSNNIKRSKSVATSPENRGSIQFTDVFAKLHKPKAPVVTEADRRRNDIRQKIQVVEGSVKHTNSDFGEWV